MKTFANDHQLSNTTIIIISYHSIIIINNFLMIINYFSNHYLQPFNFINIQLLLKTFYKWSRKTYVPGNNHLVNHHYVYLTPYYSYFQNKAINGLIFRSIFLAICWADARQFTEICRTSEKPCFEDFEINSTCCPLYLHPDTLQILHAEHMSLLK